MESTLLWVLQRAGKSFLFGLLAIALSAYVLLVTAPDFASAPFVPFPLAFGEMPWYVVATIGLLSSARAWIVGVRAKRRAGF